MDIQYMFLRDLVKRGVCSSSSFQLADVLTKGLEWVKFDRFRGGIGMEEVGDQPPQSRGA